MHFLAVIEFQPNLAIGAESVVDSVRRVHAGIIRLNNSKEARKQSFCLSRDLGWITGWLWHLTAWVPADDQKPSATQSREVWLDHRIVTGTENGVAALGAQSRKNSRPGSAWTEIPSGRSSDVNTDLPSGVTPVTTRRVSTDTPCALTLMDAWIEARFQRLIENNRLARTRSPKSAAAQHTTPTIYNHQRSPACANDLYRPSRVSMVKRCHRRRQPVSRSLTLLTLDSQQGTATAANGSYHAAQHRPHPTR